jgi:hypothetical protein
MAACSFGRGKALTDVQIRSLLCNADESEMSSGQPRNKLVNPMGNNLHAHILAHPNTLPWQPPCIPWATIFMGVLHNFQMTALGSLRACSCIPEAPICMCVFQNFQTPTPGSPNTVTASHGQPFSMAYFNTPK